MRRIRFLVLGFVSFVAATFGALLVPSSWVNRVFSTLVCGIFSFNSMVCTANWGQSSQRVVAATPPAVEKTIFDGFTDLLAQRDPSEFGDPQPSTPSPQQSNPQAPPFPQDPGPNFPVRPEFNNPNTNPINPSNSPPSQPNITGRGQGNLTGDWIFKTQKFEVNYDGTTTKCIPQRNSELNYPVSLTQNSNKLVMSPAANAAERYTTFDGGGEISGNRLTISAEFVSFDGTISNDGNQISGNIDCLGVILPFTATRKGGNENSCPSTASVNRTYTTSSSNDRKRFEVVSNLNEKVLLQLVNPNIITINYTDCQGKEWQFMGEKSNSSSQMTLLTSKNTRGLKIKIHDFNQVAIINVDNVIRCPVCETITTVLKWLEWATNADTLLNNQTVVGSTSIKLLVKPPTKLGDLVNTAWQPIESALQTLRDNAFIKPLKDSLKELSEKSLDCNSSFLKQCSETEPPPQPQPPQPPQPQLPQGTGTCAPNTFKLPEEEDKVREVCRIRLQQWVKPGPPPYISYCGVWNATFVLSCEDFMKNGSPVRRSN